MVVIRQATVNDMMRMQHCNLRNLPENYSFRYYMLHALSCPSMMYVAVDESDKIVGYVMANLDNPTEEQKKKGEVEILTAHVTSLSVLRTHRKLGIATKLMRASHNSMKNVYKCDSCSLRVRVTNRAAISLYSGVLGYKIQKIEQEYYADNENAFDMILNFNSDETKEEIQEKNQVVIDA
jgi:peptide alpha-N-acetyltransferase